MLVGNRLRIRSACDREARWNTKIDPLAHYFRSKHFVAPASIANHAFCRRRQLGPLPNNGGTNSRTQSKYFEPLLNCSCVTPDSGLTRSRVLQPALKLASNGIKRKGSSLMAVPLITVNTSSSDIAGIDTSSVSEAGLSALRFRRAV